MKSECLNELKDAPSKLHILADWFDAQYCDHGINDQVQKDLRKWADVLEKLLKVNSC